MAERDKRINGTREDAEKIEADIQSGVEDYETRLKEATLKSMEERGKLKDAALAEEQAIIESARKEANTYLEGIKGEVSQSKRLSARYFKGRDQDIFKRDSRKGALHKGPLYSCVFSSAPSCSFTR